MVFQSLNDTGFLRELRVQYISNQPGSALFPWLRGYFIGLQRIEVNEVGQIYARRNQALQEDKLKHLPRKQYNFYRSERYTMCTAITKETHSSMLSLENLFDQEKQQYLADYIQRPDTWEFAGYWTDDLEKIKHKSENPAGKRPKWYGLRFKEDPKRTGLWLLDLLSVVSSVGTCIAAWWWKGMEASVSLWGSHFTF